MLGLLAGWVVVSAEFLLQERYPRLLLTFGLFTGGLIYQKHCPPIKERLANIHEKRGSIFVINSGGKSSHRGN